MTRRRLAFVAILALILTLISAVVPSPVSAQDYACVECTQICWGWWGCEYFCVESSGSGKERCYAYTDYCSAYGNCWVHTA